MHDLFEKYKFFRRLTLVSCLCAILWVIYRTWVHTPDIPSGTAMALGTVIGLLATAIGFYIKGRSDEDKQ